jgi:hypothetical protein
MLNNRDVTPEAVNLAHMQMYGASQIWPASKGAARNRSLMCCSHYQVQANARRQALQPLNSQAEYGWWSWWSRSGSRWGR